mgnify:CR=1 FL=1
MSEHDDLRAQLAAMTAKRDEWQIRERHLRDILDGKYNDKETQSCGFYGSLAAKILTERDAVLEQLATSQARCAELETLATKLLADCLEHNQEYHYITKPELIQEARQALTPTERPPA